MARGAYIILLVVLLQFLIAQSQDDCEKVVFPEEIAYRGDNFLHQSDASCTPYSSDAASNNPTIDPMQFLHCSQPTTITDSNRSPPTYDWGEAAGNLLFIFSNEINFENITIYYISNTTGQGRPKLRIYAVPDDFQIWNELNTSYPSEVYDEVIPSEEDEGLRAVPNSNDRTVMFNTSRVLIVKITETKTYEFSISEVEFYRFCIPGGPTDSTDPETEQTTTSTTTRQSTTTMAATNTEIDPGDGSGRGTSYGASNFVVAIAALTAATKLLL